MENEKDMDALAEELIQEITGKMNPTEGDVVEAVELRMTPEKMRAYAALFPREMVEKSLVRFIGGLVLRFFGESDSERGYVLLDRAEAGDDTARKIISGVEVLAGIVACDLKGEEYDWGDDEG